MPLTIMFLSIKIGLKESSPITKALFPPSRFLRIFQTMKKLFGEFYKTNFKTQHTATERGGRLIVNFDGFQSSLLWKTAAANGAMGKWHVRPRVCFRKSAKCITIFLEISASNTCWVEGNLLICL